MTAAYRAKMEAAVLGLADGDTTGLTDAQHGDPADSTLRLAWATERITGVVESHGVDVSDLVALYMSEYRTAYESAYGRRRRSA